MRLKDLYNSKTKFLLEAEDTGQPLGSNRYPAISKHALAKYEPSVDIETEINMLKQMAFEYPKDSNPPNYKDAVRAYRRSQAAFKKLLQRLQLNTISGLRGQGEYARLSEHAQKSAAQREKFNQTGSNDYIVIAADVDDMKYLNDKTGLGHAGVNSILQNIGRLFKENFQIENTKLFHPHGDEFRVISYVGKVDQEASRLRFARLLQSCIKVADGLAGTGFYMEGWPDQRRVQPTISFGISTTDTSADGLLTHVKTGASSGKPMKYTIVVDRDLRYDLGFSPEEMNKYINSLDRLSNAAQVITIDSPEVVSYESGLAEDKTPMDSVRGKQGVVVLESSWSEVTPHRKRELEAIRRQKRAYLDSPNGIMKLGQNYIPLREAFKPSQ